MITTDPAILAADPGEVHDHLVAQGILGPIVMVYADHADITAPGATDAAIAAALADWTPTTTGMDQWIPALPAYLADHIQHLRDFRAAVRAGQTPTPAQANHALADVIDALRYLNSRVTGD